MAQPTSLSFWIADGDGVTEDHIVTYDSNTGRGVIPLVDAGGNAWGWPSDLIRVGDVVYGVDTFNEQIYTVDETTGLVTPVSTPAGKATWDTRLGSLAYAPSANLLYAFDWFGERNDLFSFSLTSNAWVGRLRDLPFSDVHGLAWCEAAQLLYLYDVSTGEIHTLDPGSGASQFVVSPVHAPGDFYDELTFFNGELYGTLHIDQAGIDVIQVRRIDLATGNVDDIGPPIVNSDGHSLLINSIPVGTSTPRNGTGVNPTGFASDSDPILGTSWDSTVATVATTSNTLLGISGASAQLPFLNGEILIDPSPPAVFTGSVTGSFSVPIPSDPCLINAVLFAQGFRFDQPGGVLTFVMLNAEDLVLGY